MAAKELATGWEYRVLKPLLLLTKDRDFALESGGSVGPGFRGSFSFFFRSRVDLAKQHQNPFEISANLFQILCRQRKIEVLLSTLAAARGLDSGVVFRFLSK